MAKICIARFFNGLHSELSRKGFELFDKTRGAIALLSQAKIATTNHFQVIDTEIFPWLERQLRSWKCEVGSAKMTHALMPFVSKAIHFTLHNDWFSDRCKDWTSNKCVDVDFLPEFATSRAKEISGKYFYVLAGQSFCPEYAMISKNFSVSCPGGKVGLVMNESLWGPLQRAFYAFLTNPKNEKFQRGLLDAIRDAERFEGFPYIIWPMDAEVYAIGSAYGLGAMEEFCELIVKNQLSETFAPVSQCLDFADKSSKTLADYPHRDLAKWFRHHEQLVWFQRISQFEVDRFSPYQDVVFQIAANSDYASAIRWRITGPSCIDECLYPDGTLKKHFIGGSEDVIAIQEAAIRSLERGRPFSHELLKAPDCTLRRRMRNIAIQLEKIKFE